MHLEAMQAVRRMMSASGYLRTASGPLLHPRRGLDVGGADVNGSARGMIPCIDTWNGLDIADGPGVDVVWDATDTVGLYHIMTFGVYDVVLCTEVLEHVKDWPLIIKNIWLFLASGGCAFITAAGTDGVSWARRPHGARGEHDVPEGEHYENVNVEHLTAAIQHTIDASNEHTGTFGVTARPNPGDVYAWIRKD
jgi:hypothetical protein